MARARAVSPGKWLGELPLRQLLDWLRDELGKRDKEERSIERGPLPKEAFAKAAAGNYW